MEKTKLEELTEKIYNEGIAKSKNEADQIVDNAKKEAADLIKKARKQADEILENAKAEALEYQKNTQTEVELAARQFLSTLKQQITKLVTLSQLETPIKESFSDTKFVKELILTIVENWDPQKPEEIDLAVLLPEKQKDQFSEFLENQTKNTLSREIEIRFDANIDSGFRIGPKDNSYVIRFSDKDFENYFSKYIKEETKEMLFAKS